MFVTDVGEARDVRENGWMIDKGVFKSARGNPSLRG